MEGTQKAIKLRLKSTVFVLSVLGTSSLPLPVAAAGEAGAAPASLSLDEVIVTARKREERLQDTPIAITAFSALDLEQRNFSSILDLRDHSPNLLVTAGAFNSGATFAPSIFIRGVGQLDFFLTTDPGVGIYVDGVYMARSVGALLDVVDFSRIEILRGPQGTLFGKNTIGGALSIVTEAPTGETRGYAEAKAGNYDRVDIKASMETSLIEDVLAARLTVASLSRDGFVKRPLMGDRLGGMDSDIGRALFQWTATEDLTVTFSIDGTRSRGDSAAEELTKFDPTASLATLWNTFIGIPQGTPISPSYVDAPKYVNMGTGLNENTLDLWGTSVTVDWDLGEIAFKSITAYREFKAHYGHDTDGTPLVYQATEYRDTQHQFSQEFQISGDSFDNRLKWVAGVFYMDEHATGDAILNVASGLYNATAGLVPPPMQVALDLDLHSLMDQKTESYAAFGQATLVLTDQFSITAGARYSKDKKDFLVDMLRMNSGVKLADNVEIDDSWSSFTPRVGIEFKANEDTLLYASASRGFKSGGFNGRPTQGPGDVKSFAPEYVWSYEAGIKADWLDRRVRTNLAVFHTDYKGIQLTSTATDPVTNILSIFVENGGKARVRGAEAELTARVTPNLDFNAAVGYTDAKYTHIEPGVQSITLASKLVKAPKWTANAGLQYGISLGDNGLILVRGDWNYKSAHFNDVANSQTTWQKGYSLFNARISYTSANELWEFAIFGTNLTDKYYYEGGVESASLGMGVAVIGRPREYGVSLKRNF